MTIIDTIDEDEAVKLNFFFNEELNTDAARYQLELERSENPPKIRIKGRESQRRVVEQWKSLLNTKLHQDVISGYNEYTFDNVRNIIKMYKLREKVLPVQSKSKASIVRIFALSSSDLHDVKHAYENPEDPLAERPSSYPEANIRPKSRHMTRHEDNNTGSFKQVELDVKFEFHTREGLHVKLYKKGITRLNVDAIVNAANDRLENVGGVAEVIAKAAGNQMKRECKDVVMKKGIIWEGTNVVTSAGNMNNYKGVIHAVGPRWSDHQDKSRCLQILEDTIIQILEKAKTYGYISVAMPPISSGIFGVPKQLCAAMYLKGILEFSARFGLGSLKEFHIIDINDDVLDMVIDWYRKVKTDPNCLNSVLKTVPHHHKGNNTAFRSNDQAYNNVRNRVGSASGFSGSMKGNDKVKSLYDHKGHEITAPTMETVGEGKKFFLKSFCGKTDIYIYSIDVLTLKGIDVIAVSEDPMLSGSGALSRALLDAGDTKYRKEHTKLKPYVLRHSTASVMLTSGGDNLPFHHVIHAVIRRSGESNEDVFQKKLQNTITKVLEKANSWVIKTKKRNIPGIKLALPVMGIGTQRDDNTLFKCCWTTMEAIKKFLQTTRFVEIKEIHLINLDGFITKVLQECFTTKPSYRPPPPTAKPDFTKPNYKQQNDPQKYLTRKIQTWKMDPRGQGHTDVSKFMKKKPKPAGNLKILGLDTEEDMENCVVCLCEFDDPVELIDCKHVFCKECIMEVFGSKPSCPVCGTVYGVVYGDQPRDGVANVYEEEDSLPGYDKKKTYVICYEFPQGRQEEFHPEPGKPYDGMKRRGFLPKISEGTEVLRLLRKAFEQGLTFTLGTSRTTGKEGVLTWNDIHHKTSRTGGPQKFGYPDPEYLSRVQDELSCKGITVDK